MMPGRVWFLGGLLWLATGPLVLQADDRTVYPFAPRPAERVSPTALPRIPIELVPPGLQERVQSVLNSPAMTSKAQPEAFQCDSNVYRWLLDHPDLAVKLWKQVGARVQDIKERGDGVYIWKDEHGSEINWHSALKATGLHMWYAEGKVKPNALLPLTSFRALAILVYREGKDVSGKPAVEHQVHFLLRCDSKTVSLAARLLGASMPRMAEQYLGQLQMFYGGMAWYLCQDEQRCRKLYRQIGLEVAEPTTP
ncbi:MAG: hypothetical protein U0840_02135 [Gemmataceae bacterium]